MLNLPTWWQAATSTNPSNETGRRQREWAVSNRQSRRPGDLGHFMTESHYGCVRYWRHLYEFSVCVFIRLCTIYIYCDVYVCTHICIHIHEQMCIRAYVYTSCALLCVRTKTMSWPWVSMFISTWSARMCCLLVLTRITCWPHQQPPVCWCMRPSEIRSSEWYPWHPGSFKRFKIPAEPKHTFST